MNIIIFLLEIPLLNLASGKRMTLGLTEEEAEQKILDGFLR